MTDATLLSPRPAHVPEALLFDFDISHDPLLTPDLHGGLIELARRTPEIFWTPRYGGHWVVRSHEAIFEVSRDYDRFSSDRTKISDNRMMLPTASIVCRCVGARQARDGLAVLSV